MGIPSYFSYIIKNHSNIIRNLQYHHKYAKTVFHSLYMDCNSIIYDSVHVIESHPNRHTYTNSQFESYVIDRVIMQIHHYIQTISPTNVLFIAFDGVAPLAKMDQQRARRYKTAFMSSISFSAEETSADPHITKVKYTPNSAKWDTTAITPGTQFMNTLSFRICDEFKKRLVVNGGHVPRVIVSTSTSPGEGEHKMFAHIRQYVKPYENVAIYGLDSDLIMLSILHSVFCRNVFIFRESPQFSNNILPLHLQNKPNDLLFLDIHQLAESILAEMNCTEYNPQRICDYILISVLLGNDFLPHIISLNLRGTGMAEILGVYAEHVAKRREYLTTPERQINWKMAKSFIEKLAVSEHGNIVAEYKQRNKLSKRKYPENTPEEREQLFQNTPTLYRGDEEYICPTEEYWEHRYYRVCFQTDIQPDIKRDICHNYIEGLEWVFRYYAEGCPHWRWKYRYNYPPLLSDLIKYVPDKNESVLSVGYKNAPFTPFVQLSYVVPPISHSLLSPKIRDLLRSQYAEYFVDISDIQFSWLFCKYFWESHVILPHIPMAVLNEWEHAFGTMPEKNMSIRMNTKTPYRKPKIQLEPSPKEV